MSEPFVGEIRMFAGNFAPRSWAFCDGQLLAVSQNDSLFSLLGTIYGGDGRTTFGLPDMRGRIPLHAGNGPGLSNRPLGSKSGTESETLSINTMPSHHHMISVSPNVGNQLTPVGTQIAVAPSPDNTGRKLYGTAGTHALNPAVIASAGGSQAHTNLMPTLCVNFIIALVGIYPSRT